MSEGPQDGVFSIRFRPHESALPNLEDRCLAAAYGLSEDLYQHARADLQWSLDQSVEGLLGESAFVRFVQNVRWPTGQVLFLGDSLTADAVSWANQLIEALRRLVPDVATRNIAVSGDTSLQAVWRIAFQSPSDLVIAMIGTNDGQLYAGEPLVSDAQTEHSLEMIERLADGRVAWVVPPGFDADRIHGHEVLKVLPMRWSEEIHARKQQIVAHRPNVLLDSRYVVEGRDANATIDGLHLSPNAHQVLATAVIAALAEASSTK